MTSFRRCRPAALVAVVVVLAATWCLSGTAAAQSPTPPQPGIPAAPLPGAADPGPASDDEDQSLDVTVDLNGGADGEAPSQTVLIILGLTVLSVAPSLLILMTSFTRMIVVLSLVRNALGLQAVPPNQVLAGLALFLSLFVMAPTLSAINDEALQPYLDGEISQDEGLQSAEGTIKEFMLANTRSSDLALMGSLRGGDPPEDIMDTSLVVVVPAYVISELQSAFIIGLVVFVPFLILDLVVSAALMSLGMMMLPPVFVSLPLKLLLFVMVDGWALITESLVVNYKGVGFI
jgi:flagellar biosynthetic protein FliP